MMGRRNPIRKLIKTGLVISILLILVTAGYQAYLSWPDPPVQELREANKALMAARIAKADKYVPKLFENTCRLYESAMNEWKKENRRFFFNRNYVRAKAFAIQATKAGYEAFTKASHNAVILHEDTGNTLSELEKIRENFLKIYAPLPLQKTIRENFNKGILLMTEAKLARERSDLALADAKLDKAKTLMVSSNKKAKEMLDNYFKSLPEWKSLVKNAIDRSARQQTSLIVVKKMDHELLLYQSGLLKARFVAEFGPNWIGEKNVRGDKATPEGIYHIVHKKDRRKTIYHKALAINYPNEEDKIRYRSSIASGSISRRQDIGGSIEIHGGGGRGFNWTNGCVALTDKEMDVVYGMVSEKTPVVIVGSTEPLDKYTN